eukprot:scaffold271630_cov17-Tisochrysis_lutea.AAC.1
MGPTQTPVTSASLPQWHLFLQGTANTLARLVMEEASKTKAPAPPQGCMLNLRVNKEHMCQGIQGPSCSKGTQVDTLTCTALISSPEKGPSHPAEGGGARRREICTLKTQSMGVRQSNEETKLMAVFLTPTLLQQLIRVLSLGDAGQLLGPCQ